MAHGSTVWHLAALCLVICIGRTLSWQNDPNCGTAPVLDPGTNIIGGGDSEKGEWPWHAALLVNEQQVRCGVTIISREWVITAANCIGFKNYPEIYSVVGGLTDLRTGDGNQQISAVTEIYIHPNYLWSDNEYDIAALKLATPFQITEYVRTICVPDGSLEDSFVPGTPCEVTGWGSTTETGYIYPILQKMNVAIVSEANCQGQYPEDIITNNMICAGENGDGKDTCNFDGGGPLMSNNFNKWYLVGVISSQYCSDTSGIFTKITALESWLEPIFDGGEPDRPGECTRFQYTCPDGWCADYATKCNGMTGDGCKEGGDERICEGYNVFFDPYFFDKHLHPNSVIATYDVGENADCARLCATYPSEDQPACLAFDVITKESGGTFPYVCNVAGSNFNLIDVPFNQSILHFEIETFPTPDQLDAITVPYGRFATTRFIRDESIVSPSMWWRFEHGLTGISPGIIFRFSVVHDNNGVCQNRVQIHNGPDQGDPVTYSECLDRLPTTNEGIFVAGTTGNLVEYIQNVDHLGFMAQYIAVNYCEEDFTTDNGMLMSPNYPNVYPEYSKCATKITAPPGYQVLVHMEDFMIEAGHGGICDTDSLAVYAIFEENDGFLLGEYCGETVPEYIQSPGQYLYLVFKSDGLIQYKGFSASYSFVPMDEPVCGIRTTPLEPEVNLIGGKDTQVGEWPWQGAIFVNGVPRCGAVLIDESWVLTTASCIDSYTFPELISVLMGVNDLAGSGGAPQNNQVSEVFVHPDFYWDSTDYNAALLKMAQPFVINDYVHTACVPDNSMDFNVGTMCAVTGWGSAEGGGRPSPNRYLQEIMVSIKNDQECADAHPDYGFTSDRMICAGADGKDTCNYDLGGPLVAEVGDQYYLAGLVASQVCDDGSKPGVYTKVSAFYDWISPIFAGNNPQKIAACTRDEYECPGGWCAGYDKKCNGINDGCIYGGDENFCDEQSEFYDPFLFNTQLTESSVEDVIGPVTTLTNCGYLCTNNPSYLCLAYDVEILDNGGYNCHLASRNFDTEMISFNRSVVHFEIETTPQPNDRVTISNGKIASPRFDPEYSGPNGDTYRWDIDSDVSGLLPGTVFRFPVVMSSESTCEEVRLRDIASGRIEYQACLSDIDISAEGVFVPHGASGVRVEFTTTNWLFYGFISKFDSVSYCNGEFNTPGYFTSPNYPNPYPSNSMCSTKITSPDGTRVSVFFQEFELEMNSDGECIDALRVYDSDSADEDQLVGVYCGSNLPPVFTASGQSLYFVFSSDSSLNYRGFTASFSAGEDGSACGEQRAPLSPEINIIGGVPAQEGEYPWQGLLVTHFAARCGAVLLTPEWAITSAFCMDTPNYPEMNRIVMGLTDLLGNSDNVQDMVVEKTYIHPQYRWQDNVWDAALLKLRTPFRITDYVRTICSPYPGTINPGTSCWATGWGTTTPGERLDRNLQEIQLDIISRQECQASYPDDAITDSMICAHTPGKDTCNWDAGGPLVTQIADKWYLAGLISSQNCNENDRPGIYTDIAALSDWIDPIYKDGEPETIPDCTYDEFTCPEGGGCVNYNTKCNGLNDGCRYSGEETSCVGFGEFFDPFLFNVALNESSVIETQTVSDNAECARLCLEKDYICLAVDVTFPPPYDGYVCHFGDEHYVMKKVDFSYANTNLQIEKFRLPFAEDSRDITNMVGKIGSPRWIPSIPSNTYFNWRLTTDISTLGRGYIFRFSVVKSKEEDPRLCQNYATFRVAGNEVARYCLNQVPQMSVFFLLYPYNALEVELNTEDSQEYGFIGKYAAVTNCNNNIEGSEGTTGTFTSPNYPDMYPPEAICTTRLTAPEGYNVLINIRDFQLENDNTMDCQNDIDTLTLYDGRFTHDELKIGRYCGTTIADYFQSSGQELTVMFKSDAFLNYKGFSIDYEFVPVQECHNNLYAPQGSFSSPLYPENYPGSAYCPTRITTTADYRILLVFLDVDLEPDFDPTCASKFDYIEIYDSYMEDEDKLIGTICNSNPPQTAFVSTGDSLFVPFTSDSSVNFRGFNAIFYTFPALSSCDNVFTVGPNTFRSPGYPEDYPRGITCESLIFAPVGYVVRLTFLDFELEGPNFNDDCIWDSVNIYNSVNADPDQLIGTYCGNKIPTPVLSTNNSMFVVFSADASSEYRGFEALFEFVSADEIGCDNVFATTPGNVTSPLYPENYPNGIVCRSLFIAPDNMIVRLDIQDFYLENDGNNCQQDYDWVKIYDADEEDESALIGQFCSNTIPAFFESTGSRLYLVFKSDSSVSRRGFSANYEFRNGPVTIAPPPPLDDRTCGIQTAPLGPITNIIGGAPADEGEWPWQGVILIKDQSGDDDLRCGATLLTSTWVVTAAHCLDVLVDPTVYSVVMGTNSLIDLSDNMQWNDVVGVYVYPDFAKDGKANDIALLRTTPFTINDYVRPVCTAPSDWEDYLAPDVLCTATGWGYTIDGAMMSYDLLEVDIPIYDRQTCSERYAPEPVTENMICAGYSWGGKDTCLGDDGGPLVTRYGDQWALVGVTSWGEGCGRENTPRVFTRITAFEDWIAPIYVGGEPDAKIPECPYDKFLCQDGWCIDYAKKCDGTNDCYHGDDEQYCEGDMLYFDHVSGKQLRSDSIRSSFTVPNIDTCAQRCIENYIEEPCLAFDTIVQTGNMFCNIATNPYNTQPNTGSYDHFEIEKMPCPGDVVTSISGRFAAPKWLPAQICRLPTVAVAGEFYWVFTPPASPNYNRLMIEFGTVHNSPPSDCSTTERRNSVLVRAGPALDDPLVGSYCLGDLPDSIWVSEPMARVEFYTVDYDTYGFLASFNAFWSCDNEFTSSPGVFTSPNYPNNYPINSECNTMIHAPEGMQVFAFMREFSLEPQADGCRFDWDTLRVYQGSEPNPDRLIGTYCGTNVPYYFRSTGRSLYFAFKSDGSVTYPGFEAAYYFVPANATMPPPGNGTDECGLQTLPMEPEDNIVGGKPAQRGEYPWQVAIYYFNTYICGGALLSPEWVVTIGSCVPSPDAFFYDIMIGSNNVNGDTDQAQFFKVSETVMHPQFDFAENRYDIAMLRLSTNATINDFVRTICLPSEQDQTDFPADTLCWVTGWGHTFSGGQIVEELNEVPVSIIDQDVCEARYAPDPVTSEMLCAGNMDGGQGVCQGDAGSPLVSQVENKWYLLGLPSWSRGCADPEYPAVYTRISEFEDWINGVMNGTYTEVMCSANYTEAPGEFQSPYYPGNYPNDVTCETLITAPEGYIVYLTVRDFRLEDDGTLDCASAWDTLSVYDSSRADMDKLFGIYCGVTIERNFISSGRHMFTRFKSDGSVTERGYDMAYYFIQDTGCNNEFTEAPGTFTSPNYPEDYPNDAECSTLITAPTRQRVLMTMQDFQLEFDEGCNSNFDTLSIYDSDFADPQKLIGVFCGDTVPESFESTGETLFVVFKSDGSNVFKGFQSAYYFLPEMMTTTIPPGPQPYCGMQTIDLQPESNVIGGKPAQVGEYPWHGALRLNGLFICGAALLTPNWAITSANCATRLEGEGIYSVVFGTNNLVAVSENAEVSEVSEVFIHPDYNGESHLSDVALLKLSNSLSYTGDYVRTICAPPENMNIDFGNGDECYVTGWGAQESGGPFVELLNEVQQNIRSTSDCSNEFYPPAPTNDQICAGEPGKGSCTGDEGGPLVREIDGVWYLAGVATRTSLCGSEPSLYARMTSYYSWLQPIFDGRDPEARPSNPPYEELEKQVGEAKDQMEMYMYLMYAFIGVVGVLLIAIIFTLILCKNESESIKQQLNEIDDVSEDIPLTSQVTSTYTAEVSYGSPPDSK